MSEEEKPNTRTLNVHVSKTDEAEDKDSIIKELESERDQAQELLGNLATEVFEEQKVKSSEMYPEIADKIQECADPIKLMELVEVYLSIKPEQDPNYEFKQQSKKPSAGVVSLLPQNRQKNIDLTQREFDSPEQMWSAYAEALKQPHDTEAYQKAKAMLPQVEDRFLRAMLRNPNRTYNLDSIPSESTPTFPEGLSKNHSYMEYSQYLRELVEKRKNEKKG